MSAQPAVEATSFIDVGSQAKSSQVEATSFIDVGRRRRHASANEESSQSTNMSFWHSVWGGAVRVSDGWVFVQYCNNKKVPAEQATDNRCATSTSEMSKVGCRAELMR